MHMHTHRAHAHAHAVHIPEERSIAIVSKAIVSIPEERRIELALTCILPRPSHQHLLRCLSQLIRLLRGCGAAAERLRAAAGRITGI